MEQVRTNKSDMSITDSIMQLDQIVSLLNLDISFKGTNCQEREICPEDKIKIIETCIGVLKDNIWNMKELLTIKEASVYLGIAKSYLYKLTSAKKIPHYKPNGKLVYFKRKKLYDWAIQNQVIPDNANNQLEYVNYEQE